MLERFPLTAPWQDVDANAPHYWPGLSRQHTDATACRNVNHLLWGVDVGHMPTLADYAPKGNGSLPPDAYDSEAA